MRIFSLFLNHHFHFLFPVVGSEQSADSNVSSLKTESPQDPQLVRESHLRHGGPQGAQAADVARTFQQPHQGHRSAQPECSSGTSGSGRKPDLTYFRSLLSEEPEGILLNG